MHACDTQRAWCADHWFGGAARAGRYGIANIVAYDALPPLVWKCQNLDGPWVRVLIGGWIHPDGVDAYDFDHCQVGSLRRAVSSVDNVALHWIK